MLNRSPSTILREVALSYYKAVDTDNRAKRMAKCPKSELLESNPELRKIIMSKLELKWSSEQTSGG